MVMVLFLCHQLTQCDSTTGERTRRHPKMSPGTQSVEVSQQTLEVKCCVTASFWRATVPTRHRRKIKSYLFHELKFNHMNGFVISLSQQKVHSAKNNEISSFYSYTL